MTAEFPVPQASVEEGLLNAINQNMERWLQVSQFSSDDFSSRREVFQFFQTYLTQYGTLPSGSQLSTRFQWQPPLGDFAYWLHEMKRYSLARQVLNVMQEGFDAITEPQKALNMVLEKLSKIRAQETNHIQSTDGSAEERLEMYDYRTEVIFNTDAIVGLRTGISIIDKTKVGWTPASLVGVVARPGVGKTWWLMWQGVNTWMDGGSVLVISPEMPANMLNLRIDTLFGAALGRPINYNMLIVGDPVMRANYSYIVDKLKGSNRWWVYDSMDGETMNIQDVATLIRLHRPSLVLIDGVSLLRSTSRGQAWEQMKENCYSLKNIGTINEIPMIITHQASNTARGRRKESPTPLRGDDDLMPSLNDIAFGDAFAQACSDVITMCGEPESPYINWFSIRKHRERGFGSNLPTRMALAVDFANGTIIDLSHLGYDREKVGLEVKRMLHV